MPDGRAHLIDGDTGRYFGSLNTGYVHARLNLPTHYREIYSAEIYYSRHVGGIRSDMVRVYDPINLTLLAGIAIANKQATTIPRLTNTALSDDGRFMTVANLTPATSVSVVDLKERKFVGEIELPGCALTIPATGRHFLSLCSDGSAMTAALQATYMAAGMNRKDVNNRQDDDKDADTGDKGAADDKAAGEKASADILTAAATICGIELEA